jgi:acetolactate synthase I/II/III large subunit
MNGAHALFKALTDAGLDTCFANPGTSGMQLVYEMGRGENVCAVLCLEENVVTGAADGYAHSGQVRSYVEGNVTSDIGDFENAS